jgi:Antitoxin VbhA
MNSPITPEEKAKRARAVAFGVANVRLEGFTIGPEAQAINDRYINGEISSAEQQELIFALAAAIRAAKG